MPKATTLADSRRRAAPAEDPLAQIQAGLAAVAHSVNQVRNHERMLHAAGVRLDRAGASLLYKLHASGEDHLRVTALAERLGVDTPTVTRKVQQLERLGLVARDADPDDRRAIGIRLTPEGRAALEALLAARRAWLGQLLEDWTDRELATFGALLARFSERLVREVEVAGDR